MQPPPQLFSLTAKNPCLTHDVPICSNRPPNKRNSPDRITGCSEVLGIQARLASPKLQEVVPTVKAAIGFPVLPGSSLPQFCRLGRLVTATSGPTDPATTEVCDGGASAQTICRCEFADLICLSCRSAACPSPGSRTASVMVGAAAQIISATKPANNSRVRLGYTLPLTPPSVTVALKPDGAPISDSRFDSPPPLIWSLEVSIERCGAGALPEFSPPYGVRRLLPPSARHRTESRADARSSTCETTFAKNAVPPRFLALLLRF